MWVDSGMLYGFFKELKPMAVISVKKVTFG